MTHALTLNWDLPALAAAMQLSEADIAAYFMDGRRISFVVERRLRDSFPGWKLAPSEGAGFDLIDDEGNNWEVRSITKNIYFCPSAMVGKGRVFEELGFLAKLDDVKGYICADVYKFPNVPVFFVPRDLISDLYKRGDLGVRSSISRAGFYKKIAPHLSLKA